MSVTSEATNEAVLTDIWSDWLLHGRHGGDPNHESTVREAILRYRDRVLDGAALAPGMVLVDVGAGDGLIAFGALDRIGASLQVTFVDISQPLLNLVEQIATTKGVREQCRFLLASAEDLTAIADGFADVVTTRAVLAYVSDKAAATREFHRVLKSGGRLSLAEPIMQDSALLLAALTNVLAEQAPNSTTEISRLVQRCRAAQLPSTKADILSTPITSFTERDLLMLLQKAGFNEIHLELRIDIQKAAPMQWSTYLDIAPRPGAPTLREILWTSFSPSERQSYEHTFRPVVESGEFLDHDIVAYLTAVKS